MYVCIYISKKRKYFRSLQKTVRFYYQERQSKQTITFYKSALSYLTGL